MTTASGVVGGSAAHYEQDDEWRKMVSGELYNAGSAYLVQERERARRFQDGLNSGGSMAGSTRAAFAHVADGVWIRPPFYFDYGRNISLGARTEVNFNCVFLDCASITVGEDCLFAPGVQVLTATHPTDPALRRRKLELARPIAIGNNVWVGAGALILPGVTIGDDSVIAAGSVVTRDVPKGVVVKGNPARVHRTLYDVV
ncbi:unnamed protein product (mitochondrion) [Plasmodiophora brassicae]|uniref:Maltose/galactoside acetyltransferase domain-containing protein n=1 Tax=Plasmodiophora brassicae TaxID=37360 RepID=A0A0G4J0X1_PLABS|nr:hypothetical protein PBRA_008444 [Plasmodiophora brassicae]SPR01588.1 unnamed protein product [Plasmodiophora brassicae]